MHIAIEVAGWLATVLILTAYGLLSSGRLNGRSKLYQWMNVCGAIGFIINSGYYGAKPSVVLNVVWMLIGLTALVRYRSRAASGG